MEIGVENPAWKDGEKSFKWDGEYDKSQSEKRNEPTKIKIYLKDQCTGH